MNNENRLFISPNFTIDYFQKFEIDQKIDVFEDRVQGWIFNVCDDIYDKGIPNNEFAILKITCSCFEMLGKFIKGFRGERQSRKYFKIGFEAIYFDTYDERSGDLFYQHIRNSIYHTGFVSPNVIITKQIGKPFGYNENDLLILNIRILVDNLRKGFNQYIKDLRNKKNQKLRENFESRFDFESRHFFNQKFAGKT